MGIIFPVTSAPIFADTITVLASYELSETDVTVTSGEVTITPTAAVSAMPYTPTESIAALKDFYHNYGDRLWGVFVFTDAFNLDQDPNWFSDTYLAIDQAR